MTDGRQRATATGGRSGKGQRDSMKEAKMQGASMLANQKIEKRICVEKERSGRYIYRHLKARG